MKRLTFLFLAYFLLIASATAIAAEYLGEHFRVELTQSDCQSTVPYIYLTSAGTTEIYRALIYVEGLDEPLEACYGILDDEDYLLVTEQGRGGTIPRRS